MSAINQADIESLNEALQNFAQRETMKGFAAVLVGFTDEGALTCLMGKGALNRLDMLYYFSKGISDMIHKMDTIERDGGVQ